MPRYKALAWGVLWTLSAGCLGTSTGNPIGGASRDGKPEPGGPGIGGEETAEGEFAYCREAGSRQVADDEQTSLGFSARDVLAGTIGMQQQTLRWLPLRTAEYGPESGEQPLTLSIARTSAAVRLVDYEQKTDGPEIGAECPDLLEIEVDVSLKTAQGALDEQFRTKLRTRSKHVARINHRIKEADLGGSLAFSRIHAEGFVFTELSLAITVTSFGTAGQLTPTLERRTADSVGMAASGALAVWGPAACQSGIAVPLDARVSGFSGQEVLALLKSREAASVRWQNGDETDLTLSFAPSEAGVCAVLENSSYTLEGKAGTLLFRGELTATSADQHIRARWPVVATARPNASGALDVIALELDSNVPRSDPSLVDDYGLHGFDVSGYDFFGVRVTFALSGGGAWSGELAITGYEKPNCPTAPVMEPGGGASSPGCPGSTPHEVARATLSND
jgi:hypothetical protein